ncbi:MAG TPA: hypothetical protein VK976_01395 [Verrucomicrobiae bacterium]|jgi:hypothetical protein|nr:hypothetical protein [Verrucomicrobiae bacterium]
MKKILICGMMLGLLTTVSFAQRGRTVGGVRPTATGPRMAPVAPMAPMASAAPNAVSNSRGSVAPSSVNSSTHAKTATPNAASTPSTAKTVTPNPNAASTSPTAKTVTPNANTVPDRTMLPDAQGVTDHAPTTTSPNQ